MQSDHRPDIAPTAGSGRGGQVGELLAEALRSVADRLVGDLAPAPSVLDCGGGSGRFAVPLAAAGAEVTVVDISIDALATLRRRSVEADVAERVVSLQGDVEAIAALVPAASFDLVLAHGILEVVDSLRDTFAAIAGTVRPGGLLSVLVSNPVASVLARALAGDLSGAESGFLALATDDQPGPVAVQRLCAQQGLVVEQVHGIGVFRDLVPGTALDLPGAREALTRLDAASAQRSPFAEIAGHVHLLARRPVD